MEEDRAFSFGSRGRWKREKAGITFDTARRGRETLS